MTRRKRRARASPRTKASEAFLRGGVATALLTALQQRSRAVPLSILRHGLQGGAAMAAATVAAKALLRRNFGLAAVATIAGAAGIWTAETLLSVDYDIENKETGHGQEKS